MSNTDKIAELEAQIAKLKEAAKAWPQVGSMFWQILPSGSVFEYQSRVAIFQLEQCIAQGTLFRTEQEALDRVRWRGIHEKLMNGCDGWRDGEENCFLGAHWEGGVGYSTQGNSHQPETPYFRNEAASKAKALVGESDLDFYVTYQRES